MWSDRSPLLGRREGHRTDRACGRGAAVGLVPGDHRRDRPRRRRLHAMGADSGSIASAGDFHSSSSACSRDPTCTPRPSFTLDLTGVIDAPEDRALLRGPDRPAAGAPGSQGAASGSGRRVRSVGWSGTSRARRVRRGWRSGSGRPTTCTGSWSPTRGAAALGRGARPRGGRGARRPARPRARPADQRRRPRAHEPVRPGHTLRPRIPIVAVTGTNGKTTTSRMVAHIARTHGLHGLVEHGRHLHRRRAGRAGDYSVPAGPSRARAPEGSWP